MNAPASVEPAVKERYFSISLPSEVRLNVTADSLKQAEEIIQAMLGKGEWIQGICGAGGFRFALRLKSEG